MRETPYIAGEITDFRDAIPARGRLLGIDAGTKTLGLATSDPSRMIATALETIRKSQWKKDKEQLRTIIEQQQICGIAIGLPINMDGTEGPRCQASRALAKECITAYGLPVILWDERMSTMAVERTMLDADLSRQKRGQHVDKLAATYILQGVLDRLHSL